MVFGADVGVLVRIGSENKEKKLNHLKNKKTRGLIPWSC